MMVLRNSALFPEPVGSVAPKVNKNDEFSHDRIAIGGMVALRCPAQSFPVPVYRLVIVESSLHPILSRQSRQFIPIINLILNL